ncbi:MAG: hypothetical protein UT86_C0003G0102 [Candidatus Magasanikbacteria bacterium GW2011_GWC2_40_17]|uniref:Transmembrane protein n=1 Tax=Candidatus Magasanikbacteria bacterium GW2011_GWA2_42_32 TaxID=1619039 RepID=A0A0G1A7J9_9BACT|nr:MAG: hypothetical protein UT86_C0003G0102 [Candidatus Magasanikbacteria bacterium GW2011_GWC2_40_17]KKS57005.1 MAG: hypothetical protein UV20_C0004G0101 [Candidatus Magasanikbacteria bacterium GW2011_GWA2_42_32]OGH85732.1 MAG: hypothetical protein A2294_03845 [Candidatus Magasanikbacteria bacterium RIFOXYB2_FULL_38_10]
MGHFLKKLSLTFLALVTIAVLFSINTCVPDGCIFSLQQNQVCQDGSCINEDVGSHLQERSTFFTAITNKVILLGLLIFFGILLWLKSSKKILSPQFIEKIKLIPKHFSFGYNFFPFLFSQGILNTKAF